MKSLCLNVELEGHDMQPISEDEGVVEKKDDDSDQALFDAIAADAKLSEEESDKALDDIAAELGELMGEVERNDNEGASLLDDETDGSVGADANTEENELIGDGEEL